jgi:hypothetical protein
MMKFPQRRSGSKAFECGPLIDASREEDRKRSDTAFGESPDRLIDRVSINERGED